MIKLNKAVIVEGKYDKITLENIIDATIIPTNGFSIFKDKEKCNLIRMIAKKSGIIVLTDSDSAGMMIRSYLKKICIDGEITNVYIPKIEGKEKRKNSFGAEKILGVEGMSEDIILNALSRSGINADSIDKAKEKISKNDMFLLGLSGRDNSKEKRENLAKFLCLPTGFSSSGFLDAVNAVFDRDVFFEEVKKWQLEADKR